MKNNDKWLENINPTRTIVVNTKLLKLFISSFVKFTDIMLLDFKIQLFFFLRKLSFSVQHHQWCRFRKKYFEVCFMNTNCGDNHSGSTLLPASVSGDSKGWSNRIKIIAVIIHFSHSIRRLGATANDYRGGSTGQ